MSEGPDIPADEPAADPPTASDAADWLPQVYGELRRLAAAYLQRERADHTLQPTALVHEAYLKLSRQAGAEWRDHAHFRAVAASAMRQILVDHARRRGAGKRGGDWLRITLDEAASLEGQRDVDLVAIDEALSELAKLDGRKSRVVELRFFGGLTCAEAAHVVGVAPKTAEADWYMARAWLRRAINRTD